MARRSRTSHPDDLRKSLITLLSDYERLLHSENVRAQVRGLIPAHHLLRDLGGSLVSGGESSARNRILEYLRRHVGQVVDGDELMVVAGISEYARRIRELRVQEGWPILSGHTARDMLERTSAGEAAEDLPPEMGPDQYLLQQDAQDRDAAHRWFEANRIRKLDMSIRDKLLAYLSTNVERPVSGEELRYVSGDKAEWARRIRELRIEEGWRIVTRYNGNPGLPVGVYLLASRQELPKHDRRIPDTLRREVLERDRFTCQWPGCGWMQSRWSGDDRRHLEVHSLVEHEKYNGAEGLITYCDVHHDAVHEM